MFGKMRFPFGRKGKSAAASSRHDDTAAANAAAAPAGSTANSGASDAEPVFDTSNLKVFGAGRGAVKWFDSDSDGSGDDDFGDMTAGDLWGDSATTFGGATATAAAAAPAAAGSAPAVNPLAAKASKANGVAHRSGDAGDGEGNTDTDGGGEDDRTNNGDGEGHDSSTAAQGAGDDDVAKEDLFASDGAVGNPLFIRPMMRPPRSLRGMRY